MNDFEYNNKESKDNNSSEDSYKRVIFEGDLYSSSSSSYMDVSKMVENVIKYSGGLIKNRKEATSFLFGFVVIAFIITLFIIFNGGKNKVEKRINLETGQEILPGQVPGEI